MFISQSEQVSLWPPTVVLDSYQGHLTHRIHNLCMNPRVEGVHKFHNLMFWVLNYRFTPTAAMEKRKTKECCSLFHYLTQALKDSSSLGAHSGQISLESSLCFTINPQIDHLLPIFAQT